MSVDGRIKEARATARREAEDAVHRIRRDVWVDRPADFLAARENFKERWEAIHKEGETKGYLVWEGDYEGQWVVDTSTKFKSGSEFAESEKEYRKRVTDRAEAIFDAMVRRGLR